MKKFICLLLIGVFINIIACKNQIKNKENPHNKSMEIDELQKEKNEIDKNQLKKEKEELYKKDLDQERLKNSLEHNLNEEKKKDKDIDLSKPETLDKTETIPNKKN